MMQKNIKRHYRRYRRTMNFSSVYWLRWMKASLLIVIAPVMVLSIYVIYGKLTIADTLYGAIAAFIISLLFIRPYLSDLSALTHYVEQLAQNRTAQAPSLSFLSNVEKLSASVNELHDSWRERRLMLEETIIESKIVFDILPDIVIMLDKNLQILRTNSAANVIFKKRVTHQKLQELLPDPTLLSFIKWVMHDKKSKDLEVYLPEPLNRYYLVHIEKFPVYSPAGIAVIIVMHDISESKHTEKLFADFVANASHEIRTPLTSLIGFIETLQEAAENDPEARKKFLKIMAEQGERMSCLVSDLLSLSKIEMKSHTPPTEKVAIKEILEVVISQLEWTASDRNITMNLIAGEDACTITGDRNELIQLFTNLIENAIKYGNEGSEVTITMQQVTNIPKEVPSLKSAKRALAIEVRDQGEGIEKEHISRLTERFYRVDSARARKSKIGGTGLGLSIVKHIVKRHQGGLIIDSTVGVGSSFTVYFMLDEDKELGIGD
jgi:two-component system, OmpR family, phosphate regulon sensor histidine kinase PhoR